MNKREVVIIRIEMNKREVVIIRIESYFFGFHAKIRCNLNDISYVSETQKNNFQFLKHVSV